MEVSITILLGWAILGGIMDALVHLRAIHSEKSASDIITISLLYLFLIEVALLGMVMYPPAPPTSEISVFVTAAIARFLYVSYDIGKAIKRKNSSLPTNEEKS